MSYKRFANNFNRDLCVSTMAIPIFRPSGSCFVHPFKKKSRNTKAERLKIKLLQPIMTSVFASTMNCS